MQDKLHELTSHFPAIAQRTPSIITSSCWKSTVSDVTAYGIDGKGRVQNVTCSLALTIRNVYDYKTKEYVDVLTSQSLSLWFQHKNLLYLFYKLQVTVILNSYSFLIDWAHESVTFWTRLYFFLSIQDAATSPTVLFQQLYVIMEGVIWGKWECSSWSLSCTDDLLWL